LAYQLRIQFRNNDSPALTALYGGGEGGLSHWLKNLKQRLDRDAQAVPNQEEIDYINTSLATAYDTVVRNYGADPAAWQNRFASVSGAATVPYHGTLEGFGTLDRRYDPVFTGLLDIDGGTLWSQKSQSYSQWVNLGDINSSLSLLPVGLSEDPASPHFKDQGALWVTGDLHPAPLDESIVESLAEKTTLLTFTPAPKNTRRK
jgi:penicillin amidase